MKTSQVELFFRIIDRSRTTVKNYYKYIKKIYIYDEEYVRNYSPSIDKIALSKMFLINFLR